MFFDAKVVFFGAQPKAFLVGIGSRYPLYLFKIVTFESLRQQFPMVAEALEATINSRSYSFKNPYSYTFGLMASARMARARPMAS